MEVKGLHAGDWLKGVVGWLTELKDWLNGVVDWLKERGLCEPGLNVPGLSVPAGLSEPEPGVWDGV